MNLTSSQQRLLLIGGLLVWSIALVVFRMSWAAERNGIGLLWNLFLASLPLLWGAGFQKAMERNRLFLAAIWFVLWFLFLPNAPYLLTDMVHLSPKPPVPLWFVLAMLLSCAATGTLLGYLSLFDVQIAVERKWGVVSGWIVAVSALMGCGFGIYLGRFLRWNSWDSFTRPLTLAKSIAKVIADSGKHPSPIAVTLIFGGGLIIGYIALRLISTQMNAK